MMFSVVVQLPILVRPINETIGILDLILSLCMSCFPFPFHPLSILGLG